MLQQRLLCFLLVLIPAVAGCGPDRPGVYPAQGKVVFSDGKPVKLGTVEFLSEEHQLSATGTIRNNGSFLLGTFATNDGVVAGKHRVIVTQMVVNDTIARHVQDHGDPVDPVYSSYNTSPLEVTVTSAGPNEIILTVEKAKRPDRESR